MTALDYKEQSLSQQPIHARPQRTSKMTSSPGTIGFLPPRGIVLSNSPRTHQRSNMSDIRHDAHGSLSQDSHEVEKGTSKVAQTFHRSVAIENEDLASNASKGNSSGKYNCVSLDVLKSC